MDYRGLCRCRGSREKSTVIVQARQHGSLDMGGGTGDGEKWLCTGCILEKELFRLAYSLDVRI